MKKSFLVLLAILPALAFAQVKPSLTKAEAALRANKLDEAKAIIDATTGSDDFMKDKKGNPSKNAAKAWYMRGLIYAAMDTTSKEQFNKLDPHPFNVAKEAFDKCKEIDGDKTASFVNGPDGFPLITTNVNIYLAQKYFSKAVSAYQDKKDYALAFQLTEETVYFIPNDTMVLMNAGLFFGPSAKEYEKSVKYLNLYFEKGGQSTDAWSQLFGIYRDYLKDNDKALETAQRAMKAHPGNSEFPKYELDMFVKMNKLPEAKASMQRNVDAHPDDKEAKYYLGLINAELGDRVEAKKWYEEAIKLDPKYFEAQFALADVVYTDAKKVKQEMNQLGITPAEKKKRFELDKVYVEKLQAAQPYFETCEKLSPDDAKVLDTLLSIYSDLDNQPQIARISKKMKALGLLD